MDQPHLLLKSHNYFRDLSDEIIDDLAEHVRVKKFQPGDVVNESNETNDDIQFVVEGRIKVVRVEGNGIEILFGMAGRGDQLGMIMSALSEPMPLRSIAVEPTTLLMLDQEKAFEISARHPDLRRQWRSKLAGALAKHFLKDDRSSKKLVVACFHGSKESRRFTNDLIQELRPYLSGQVGLITDFKGATIPSDAVAHHFDHQANSDLSPMFQQLSEWKDIDIVFIDLEATIDIEVATRICSLSEKVVWWLDSKVRKPVVDQITLVESKSKGFQEKFCAAWNLGDEFVSPIDAELDELVSRQFKISSKQISDNDNLTPSIQQGIVRLANHLRGIQVGLALGGGAARGMGHLGVLSAFEEAGIVIDRIAGTSAGAMVGSLYSWGLSPEFMTRQFAIDLKPSILFRMLPKGLYWNLFYKYRWGRFGPMLRKYIGTDALEQLQIPSSTVAVDLVQGDELVRERGETVNSILESINLPVLSVPMMKQDKALIDGGFINNVPADVLVKQGCNIVIAVDVVSKMEEEFLKIRPGSQLQKKVYPNFLQTYLRLYAVQSSKLTKSGVRSADVTIQPDLSEFSLANFTDAEKMATIGKAAAEEQIPRIKQLITSLEKRIQRSSLAKR